MLPWVPLQKTVKQFHRTRAINPHYLLSRERDGTTSRSLNHTCCTRSSGPRTPRKTTYPNFRIRRIPTLNTLCTCIKSRMLKEVRNFPSLTLGLVSLQYPLVTCTHPTKYSAVLRIRIQLPIITPMVWKRRAEHILGLVNESQCATSFSEIAEEMKPT